MEISHEQFIAILKEKDKYGIMKKKLKSVSEKQENMRLNSVNSKSLKKISGIRMIYISSDLTGWKTCENAENLGYQGSLNFLVCV